MKNKLDKKRDIEKEIWKIFHNGCFCDKYEGTFENHYKGLVEELVKLFEAK